jgi:hypothetical protein
VTWVQASIYLHRPLSQPPRWENPSKQEQILVVGYSISPTTSPPPINWHPLNVCLSPSWATFHSIHEELIPNLY